MDERRNLHVRVSADTYEAFVSFANRHGITLTALIEAMGERLSERDAPLTEPGRLMVARAREIDQRHRSRRDKG